MTSAKKAIRLARIFEKYLRVSMDNEGKILVGIPQVWIKSHPKSETRKGLVGRGNDFELACQDFLSEANGYLVSEDPKKELAVFIL